KRAVGQAPEPMCQCKRCAKADVRGDVVVCVASGASIPVDLITVNAVVYVEPRRRKAVTEARSAAACYLRLLAQHPEASSFEPKVKSRMPGAVWRNQIDHAADSVAAVEGAP